MSGAEASPKDRERHSALQGMTLFLTWQSAELNSRPLTRRRSPLKEACKRRTAAGLSFLKGEWFALAVRRSRGSFLSHNKGLPDAADFHTLRFFPGFVLYICSAVFSAQTSTLRFSLEYQLFSFLLGVHFQSTQSDEEMYQLAFI